MSKIPDYKNHRDGTTPQELHDMLNRNKPQAPYIQYGRLTWGGEPRILIVTRMGHHVVSIAVCKEGGNFDDVDMNDIAGREIAELSEAEFLAEYLKLNP